MSPQWTDIGEAVGCKIQRLANPSTQRLFAWKACSDVPNCEIAPMAESPFLGSQGNLGIHSGLFDDGTETKLALQGANDVSRGIAVIASEDGGILEAFRGVPDGQSETTYCSVPHVSISGTAIGGLVYAEQPSGNPDYPNVKLANLTVSLVSGESRLLEVEYGGTGLQVGFPSFCMVGSQRFLWYCGGASIATFAVQGASLDAIVNRHADDGPLGLSFLSPPSVAVDKFLFSETYADPSVVTRTRVMITDGVVEPTGLVPPGLDYDVARPQYAGTHFTWQKLIHPLRAGGVEYQKVEIWASPFTTTAAQVQPFKVTDSIGTTELDGLSTAGFGRYAAYESSVPPVTMGIWNLSTLNKVPRALPPDKTGFSLVGLTHKYLYTMGRAPGGDNSGQYLFRFPVE